VINRFGNKESTNLTTKEEKLIDFKNDKLLESNFWRKEPDEFWISVNKLYFAVSSKAIKVILPFASYNQ